MIAKIKINDEQISITGNGFFDIVTTCILEGGDKDSKNFPLSPTSQNSIKQAFKRSKELWKVAKPNIPSILIQINKDTPIKYEASQETIKGVPYYEYKSIED